MGHCNAHTRVIRGELSRLSNRVGRVPGIVLVEKKLSPPPQELDALLAARILGGAVEPIRVLGVAHQECRASSEGEPFRVSRSDAVVVVRLDHFHEHALGVATATGPDKQLAKNDVGAMSILVGRESFELSEGLRVLSAPRQRLGGDR